jgi:hypothetical protein
VSPRFVALAALLAAGCGARVQQDDATAFVGTGSDGRDTSTVDASAADAPAADAPAVDAPAVDTMPGAHDAAPLGAGIDPSIACSAYRLRTIPRPAGLTNLFGALADGRILFESAIYDPWTGAASSVAAKSKAKPATLLADGRFLFLGGRQGGKTGAGQTWTGRYDPWSDWMVPTAEMHHRRDWIAATTMLDGRVLVVGGQTYWSHAERGPLAPPEIYDPLHDVWRDTATLPLARDAVVTALLPDGQVLVVGGLETPREGCIGTCPPWKPSAAAEIYDPATDTFRVVASMHVPRSHPFVETAKDGSVYVFGESEELRGERFDPATETWTWTAPAPRTSTGTLYPQYGAAWLPCGGLAMIMTTGDPAKGPPPSLVVYEPSSDTWRSIPHEGSTPWAMVGTPIGAHILAGGSPGTKSELLLLAP